MRFDPASVTSIIRALTTLTIKINKNKRREFEKILLLIIIVLWTIYIVGNSEAIILGKDYNTKFEQYKTQIS